LNDALTRTEAIAVISPRKKPIVSAFRIVNEQSPCF
jgi:hypothetical protein